MLGSGFRTVISAVAVVVLPTLALAQTDQIITFPSTVPATIRQTSGVVARGNLVKITPALVVIRNTKGKEIELEMTTIRTLRTLDGELQFIPSQDSYDDLLKRASRVAFATVEAETSDGGDGSGGPSGPRPNRPPAFALRGSLPPRPAGDELDDAGGFANPGGFGGIDDGGFGPPRDLQPMAGRAEPRMPVVESAGSQTSGEYGEEAPRRTGFENVIRDAPHGNGNADTGGARAPAQPPAGSQAPVAATQDFSITTMPMWAKVGFFGVMVGVFYVVVLRKW